MAGGNVFHTFEGESADDVWRSAMVRFADGQSVSPQETRYGPSTELLHATFCIQDPRQRWIISRRPAINPALAIAEVIWILQGRNDAAFLNRWNSQLPRYAGTGPAYHGAYGYRLRTRFGLDQLERAYQALLHNPVSRQVVLLYWDPRIDLPSEDGMPIDPDIPCNIASFLKLRNGRLEWMQVMRSNDIHMGFPHNVVQFTSLQEILAGWLGVEPGSYHHVSDSLHLYQSESASANLMTDSLALRNVDSLALPRQEFGDVLSLMGQSMEKLGDRHLSIDEIPKVTASANLPAAYRHLLCVVGAEAARRAGHAELSQIVMTACHNTVLCQLWTNWLERIQSGHPTASSLSSD